MYWQTTHEVLTTPGISSVMSRICFEQIFRYLLLADNSMQIPAGDPGHDKLFKVWPFVDLVTAEFESLYTQITLQNFYKEHNYQCENISDNIV